MTNPKPAHFFLRVLASTIDSVTLFLVMVWLLSFAAASKTLPELVYWLFVFVLVMYSPIWLIYATSFIYYFGATPGKLLSGIKIVGENGKKLSVKRILFRQTIGYLFSMLFLGLGYWAILKDAKRQAWHDKAVGSEVIVVRPIWPIGLLALIATCTLLFFVVSYSVTNALSGPLKGEVEKFITPFVKENRENYKEDTNSPDSEEDDLPNSVYDLKQI